MRWPRVFRGTRETAEREVRAELEAHFSGSVDLLVSRGWSEEAARAEVQRRFGNESKYRRELVRLARRRMLRDRVRRLLASVPDVFALAWRDVRRQPGASLGVALILAVGIGVTGAVFRVIDLLLLSPPPHVEEPARVRRLYQTVRFGAESPGAIQSFTYRDVRALRESGGAVSIAAGMHHLPETLGAGAEAVRVRIARVDSAYLSLLGVSVALGRGLLPEDHRAGAVPVAVLLHGLWTTRFGGDTAVIGRTFRLARGEYEIVGVMPRGFTGAEAPATEVWVPLEPDAADRWGPGWTDHEGILAFQVLVRLPEGVDARAWATRMEPVLRRGRSDETPPGALIGLSAASLAPGAGPDPGAMVAVSRWLAAVSLLVLLVACANAANLMLAQAERRRQATAVRVALGAGSGFLRLETMARALMLALAGGVLAVLAAWWGGRLLESLFLGGLELPTRSGTVRLLVCTGGVAVLASLLSGAMPAFRLPSGDVRGLISAGSRSTGSGGGVRRALVLVQVALSMLLVVGAGLFVRSFSSALDVDLGFDHDRVLMIRLEQDEGSGKPRAQLYDEVSRELAPLPEVSSSSTTIGVPFVLLYGLSGGLPGAENMNDLNVNAVGPAFFRTMGIAITRGRAIEARDLREGARSVVVVSERAAARLWPSVDPLGRCLRIGEETGCATVIGVATDHAGVTWVRGALSDPGTMQAWVPAGHPEATPPAALMVRTAVPPARTLDAVRRAAAGVPGVRFVEAATMEEFVDRELRSWRTGAAVFSTFGAIALAVAAAGIYGVLAFEVAQRRREFGVRRALGAGRLHVMLPVVATTLPTVAAGLVVGAIAALALAGHVTDLLFQTSPRDAQVHGWAAGVLVLTAVAAVAIPAWRAASVDPREALSEV